jgi:hypothetical protein
MQTFLPYRSFERSARCLDSKRLGKQRVEAYQILDIIYCKNASTSWKTHPAVLMWIGHEEALRAYFNAVSREWIRRGYEHNLGLFKLRREEYEKPKWLTDDYRLILSHRSNLVRKLPEHYRKYFPNISPDLPYFWPVTKEDFKAWQEGT